VQRRTEDSQALSEFWPGDERTLASDTLNQPLQTINIFDTEGPKAY